jgi:malate dehydrogenase (oxaloacetate-decarboxylating)
MSDSIIETSLASQEILSHSLLNKGSSFSFEERSAFGLHGLLPPHISTIEEQVTRRYKNFSSITEDAVGINKYLFLKHLQDRNEILFYRLVLEHCEEMTPYIYTPTVGEAALIYSNIYTGNRGLYFSYALKDKMEEMLNNYRIPDVEAIVVTDGSRILGLGDMGVGGMVIPIGKLSLYTLFGGIHPSKTLPILLDVGTDNQELLKDPLYLGSKHPRIKGKDYDDFIECFITAVKKKYPRVLLQWEDFSKEHAHALLDRYRDKLCSFNDDIQGTASVALSAILSALKSKKESLKDQRIAILGGGSAGIGIAHYIAKALKALGLSDKEVYSKFYIVDIKGLIHTKLEGCYPTQLPFAQEYDAIKHWKLKQAPLISLEDVIECAKPTILLGVSAQSGAFTKSVIETMCGYCKRPIIFPLSNPTSKAEASSKDLISWSKGEALVATGSPADIIIYQNQTFSIGQCNNFYIFPGIALGVIASKTSCVTDEMFLKAAQILSEYAPILKNPQASLFPSLKDLRSISKTIGIEVAKLAFERGTARAENLPIETLIQNTIWYPDYPTIKRKK